MKWFKHDSNAHTDDKIQKVLMKYGADGYALYWYCIELIAARVSPDNITFELKHDAEILGYHLKIDTLRVEEIMKYMISLDLFNLKNNRIVCYKLARRLDNTLSQNPQIKETLSNFKKLEADQIRSDQIRQEEKSKKPKAKRFVPPSLQEVVEYGQQRKASPDLAKQFHEYFEVGNWYDAKGNKVQNWKQKFITWQKFEQQGKKLPEPVNANSHNTFEENQRQQQEQELAMAQRAGFKTVKEWNDHQYKEHMARLGVKV